MAGSSSRRVLRTSDIKPGHVFHGEEMFFGRQFLRDLHAAIEHADAEKVDVETFLLSETPWRDILDVARTLPFAFSPWRALVVEADPDEAEELTAEEQINLKEYFAAPAPKTIIVVLLAGKTGKAHPLLKLFASFPRAAVEIEECKKPKKGKDLEPWLNERLAAAGKKITPEAGRRLIEAAANEPGLLSQEIDKLATYIGERKIIDVPDVDLLATGAREFQRWEFTDRLEKGDVEGCLRFVKKLFDEVSYADLLVLAQFADFFRDLLIARTGLREKRSREEIFAELRPRITANYGSFYWDKLRGFFRLVDGLRERDISRLVGQLERTDLMIKTAGGDTDPQALLEAVIFDYGRVFRSSGLTSQGWG